MSKGDYTTAELGRGQARIVKRLDRHDDKLDAQGADIAEIKRDIRAIKNGNGHGKTQRRKVAEKGSAAAALAALIGVVVDAADGCWHLFGGMVGSGCG